MMAELEKENPAFKFSLHKGYGTKLHYEELRRWGTTEMHRKSFLRGLRHFSSNVSQSAAA
jgi:ribonuclease HII